MEDNGLRITTPRQKIVDFIHEADEGFTAEQIIDQLAEVSRATVFRTLKILLESDVICRLSTQEGTPIYSLSRADHHHHTVCVSCGKVGDFRASTVERLLKDECRVLEIYKSEINSFPFPRSEKTIRAKAMFNGSQSGFLAAEAFELLLERN